MFMVRVQIQAWQANNLLIISHYGGISAMFRVNRKVLYIPAGMMYKNNNIYSNVRNNLKFST